MRWSNINRISDDGFDPVNSAYQCMTSLLKRDGFLAQNIHSFLLFRKITSIIERSKGRQETKNYN